ncbi:MAG: DUF1150 family protein [Alphaproteobacteria bacterium]|nr:DUF1150 family protein [Alphaproteobacteria bacterium]
MDQQFDIDGAVTKPIVYVRPVAVKDLPAELRAETGDLSVLYSVHDKDGQRLALVGDRKLAFALARQYDFAPENVH